MWRAFEINRENGKLATAYTPEELRERRVYQIYPPEAADWVREQGIAQPPTEYDMAVGAGVVDAEVGIMAPLPFSYVKGQVEIRGNARLDGFANYRVEFGEGISPTAWAQIGPTHGEPVGEGVRRMDILTLLTFVWPELQNVFPRDPDKLLIVGAGDPMWRGGLSAPNSLYLHADRPLVSENGTSSLVHELVHVFSRISDTDRSDWISEGLAEYYAIELMRRAGGMSEGRYQAVREHLTDWSRGITSLRTEQATGPVTARAVLLLQELDREIRQRSKGRHSLDDVSRGLMRLDKVSTDDFIDITAALLGGASKVLATPLLR